MSKTSRSELFADLDHGGQLVAPMETCPKAIVALGVLASSMRSSWQYPLEATTGIIRSPEEVWLTWAS
jgi:hypothetical protein